MGRGPRQGRGHRAGRATRRAKKATEGDPPDDEVRFLEHPRFGSVPYRPGKGGWGRIFDPDHRPPLPQGAVRGDIRRQVFCRAHSVPKYFYVDEHRRCVQCGSGFVFGAAEQKYWYESLSFSEYTTAIRCVHCRKARRTDRAVAHALQEAVIAAAAHPESATALVELARATLESRRRLQRGDLDRGIAAARAARRNPPPLPEAWFYEAELHRLAGRPAKADDLLRTFVRHAAARRLRRLLVETRRLLGDVPG